MTIYYRRNDTLINILHRMYRLEILSEFRNESSTSANHVTNLAVHHRFFIDKWSVYVTFAKLSKTKLLC